MAVKVVSEKPVKTKRVVCPNCAYELEFTGEDIRTSFDYDGDRYQTIACPRDACRSLAYGQTAPGPTVIHVKWP